MRILTLLLLSLAVLTPQMRAAAHDGGPHTSQELWKAWNLDAPMLFGMGAMAWLYGRGVFKLWKRAGLGRGLRAWQAGLFTAGMLALGISLVSPLEALAGWLLSAHMVQHLLLMLVAAPLILLGAPQIGLAWGLPSRLLLALDRWQRQRTALGKLWRTLTHPGLVWVLHAAVLLTWHIPGLYQWAIEDRFVHILEHASFLLAALLFWGVVLNGFHRNVLNEGAKILFLFTTGLVGGLLGALLTFSTQVWYPIYDGRSIEWGISPLADQQLAGLIMWIPANFIYLLAVLLIIRNLIRDPDRRDSSMPGGLKEFRPGEQTMEVEDA